MPVDVALNHSSISDPHIEITCHIDDNGSNNSYTLRDFGSANCTFVKATIPGSRFEKVYEEITTQIYDGCILRLGLIECTFRIINEQNPPTEAMLLLLKQNRIHQNKTLNIDPNATVSYIHKAQNSDFLTNLSRLVPTIASSSSSQVLQQGKLLRSSQSSVDRSGLPPLPPKAYKHSHSSEGNQSDPKSYFSSNHNNVYQKSTLLELVTHESTTVPDNYLNNDMEGQNYEGSESDTDDEIVPHNNNNAHINMNGTIEMPIFNSPLIVSSSMRNDLLQEEKGHNYDNNSTSSKDILEISNDISMESHINVSSSYVNNNGSSNQLIAAESDSRNVLNTSDTTTSSTSSHKGHNYDPSCPPKTPIIMPLNDSYITRKSSYTNFSIHLSTAKKVAKRESDSSFIDEEENNNDEVGDVMTDAFDSHMGHNYDLLLVPAKRKSLSSQKTYERAGDAALKIDEFLKTPTAISSDTTQNFDQSHSKAKELTSSSSAIRTRRRLMSEDCTSTYSDAINALLRSSVTPNPTVLPSYPARNEIVALTADQAGLLHVDEEGASKESVPFAMIREESSDGSSRPTIIDNNTSGDSATMPRPEYYRRPKSENLITTPAPSKSRRRTKKLPPMSSDKAELHTVSCPISISAVHELTVGVAKDDAVEADDSQDKIDDAMATTIATADYDAPAPATNSLPFIANTSDGFARILPIVANNVPSFPPEITEAMPDFMFQETQVETVLSGGVVIDLIDGDSDSSSSSSRDHGVDEVMNKEDEDRIRVMRRCLYEAETQLADFSVPPLGSEVDENDDENKEEGGEERGVGAAIQPLPVVSTLSPHDEAHRLIADHDGQTQSVLSPPINPVGQALSLPLEQAALPESVPDKAALVEHNHDDDALIPSQQPSPNIIAIPEQQASTADSELMGGELAIEEDTLKVSKKKLMKKKEAIQNTTRASQANSDNDCEVATTGCTDVVVNMSTDQLSSSGTLDTDKQAAAGLPSVPSADLTTGSADNHSVSCDTAAAATALEEAVAFPPSKRPQRARKSRKLFGGDDDDDGDYDDKKGKENEEGNAPPGRTTYMNLSLTQETLNVINEAAVAPETAGSGRVTRKRIRPTELVTVPTNNSSSSQVNSLDSYSTCEIILTEPLSSTSSSPSSGPRVIFTGIEADAKMTKMAHRIGGVIVTNPLDATHMIVGDEFKRTAKVMIAINANIPYIIHSNWLVDSAKRGSPIPITDYSSKYIVRDKVKEELWKFDLSCTLSLPRGNVFAGVSFYITSGVCGVKAPSEEEMKVIIMTGGGRYLTSIEELLALAAEEKPISNNSIGVARIVVISTVDALRADHSLYTDIARLLNNIRTNDHGMINLCNPDFIFLAVLRQVLSFDECSIDITQFNEGHNSDPSLVSSKVSRNVNTRNVRVTKRKSNAK